MNFGEATVAAFRQYFDFSGRSQRSAYWYFILFGFLAGIVTALIDIFVFKVNPNDPNAIYPLNTILTLAMLIPSISLTARRLHDVDRSGWWMLIAFTIIGIIPLLIWYCTEGTEGDNRFGADPLAGQH